MHKELIAAGRVQWRDFEKYTQAFAFGQQSRTEFRIWCDRDTMRFYILDLDGLPRNPEDTRLTAWRFFPLVQCWFPIEEVVH